MYLTFSSRFWKQTRTGVSVLSSENNARTHNSGLGKSKHLCSLQFLQWQWIFNPLLNSRQSIFFKNRGVEKKKSNIFRGVWNIFTTELTSSKKLLALGQPPCYKKANPQNWRHTTALLASIIGFFLLKETI